MILKTLKLVQQAIYLKLKPSLLLMVEHSYTFNNWFSNHWFRFILIMSIILFMFNWDDCRQKQVEIFYSYLIFWLPFDINYLFRVFCHSSRNHLKTKSKLLFAYNVLPLCFMDNEFNWNVNKRTNANVYIVFIRDD